MANYLLGTSEIQMYYCIYLIQMILLLPLLKKGIESRYRNVLMMFVLLAGMAVAYVKVYLGIFLTILSPICLTFIIYYVIGLYVKEYADGRYNFRFLDYLKKRNLRFVVGCVLIGLFAALVEGAGRYPNLLLGQTIMANYFYCIAILALLLSIFWKYGRQDCPVKLYPLVWLGEQSFSIYLCHMVIMRPVIIWLENINMAYPGRQIILFFGTLGSCVVIIVIKNIICTKCLVGSKEK